MKTTGLENIQPLPSKVPQPQKHAGRTADFENMLRKTLDHSNSPGTSTNCIGLSEPRALQNFGQSTLQSENLTDKASRAIDLLEEYSNALSDPRETLKDIEPKLSAFINETESIYKQYTETDTDNAEMKDIMESLLRTARSEAVRFRRGDYVDI